MDWLRSHSWQVTFLVGYLFLLAYHAWHGSRKSKSLDDFLVGGRGIGGIVIALSYYATFVSSVTFVGHSGKSYTRGPAWWLTCVVVFTVMVFLAWFVVAPPFVKASRKVGALTIPDFLGHRYKSKWIRRLSAIVIVAASVVYMAAVYDGAARLSESLFDASPSVVMIAIFLIVTTYTLSGGFHSVVATDAVQGLILFGGAIVLPAAMIFQKGGIGPLLTSVREANPDALNWTGDVPLATMIGLALGVGLKIVVEPRQLSRFYGLSSDEQLRHGRWIAPAMLFLTFACMLPVGFLAHAYVPAADVMESGKVQSDLVVPHLLSPNVNVLGTVLGAFFMTALAAAAMSSLDSVLLVAASSVDHDLISPNRDPRAAMQWTRLWILILSATAATLALIRAQGIVELSSFSGSLYAACFLPSLVVGLFWKRATRIGALTSLIVGFTVTTAWFFAKKSASFESISWIHEVYVGMTISLACYVVVSQTIQERQSETRGQ